MEETAEYQAKGQTLNDFVAGSGGKIVEDDEWIENVRQPVFANSEEGEVVEGHLDEIIEPIWSQALESVVDQVSILDTINALAVLPGRIAEAENQLADARQELEQHKAKWLVIAKEALDAAILAASMAAPVLEKDPDTGRKLLAKEKDIYRDAYIAADPAVIAAKAELAAIERETVVREAELEQIDIERREQLNRFSALRHIAGLQEASLRLYGEARE